MQRVEKCEEAKRTITLPYVSILMFKRKQLQEDKLYRNQPLCILEGGHGSLDYSRPPGFRWLHVTTLFQYQITVTLPLTLPSP